jgi:hypothetical protein
VKSDASTAVTVTNFTQKKQLPPSSRWEWKDSTFNTNGGRNVAGYTASRLERAFISVDKGTVSVRVEECGYGLRECSLAKSGNRARVVWIGVRNKQSLVYRLALAGNSRDRKLYFYTPKIWHQTDLVIDKTSQNAICFSAVPSTKTQLNPQKAVLEMLMATQIIEKSSAHREIVFVRANHWTTSLASLVHFTSRHAISLRLILTVIMPIICLLNFLHFAVKSGTKMRQRKPASSSVMTPGR